MDTQPRQSPGLVGIRDDGRHQPHSPPAEAGRADNRGLPAELPPDAVEILRRIFTPAPRPEPLSLDSCKKAARTLTESDRGLFALWVSRGMKD